MKFKNLAVIASILSLAAAANAQTDISSQFVNLDFNAGVANTGPLAFDNPASDVPGWVNGSATMIDSGVEGPGAWWPHDNGNWAAFMRETDKAYNLGTYTIQAGDSFVVDFKAGCWWDPALFTATLFYDNPANVIGTYTTPDTLPHWGYNEYTSDPIAATPEAVGHQLGILFENTDTGTGNGDLTEIKVSLVPEPATISLVAVAGLGMLLGRRRFVK